MRALASAPRFAVLVVATGEVARARLCQRVRDAGGAAVSVGGAPAAGELLRGMTVDAVVVEGEAQLVEDVRALPLGGAPLLAVEDGSVRAEELGLALARLCEAESN